MTRKQQRGLFASVGVGLLALAVGLALFALRDNIVFFYSPSDLVRADIAPERRARLGGLVQEGSVVRAEGETVRFTVTDGAASVPVVYTGILPDLFREGQGVVAEGHFTGDNVFIAQTVLAKHDENYMPPEVAEALKRAGRWRHAEDGAPAAEGGAAYVKPVME